MYQEIKKEIERQFEALDLRFNVESVEEHFEKLGEAADLIRQVYLDCPTVSEMVDAWIEDTFINYPDEIVVRTGSENAETPA